MPDEISEAEAGPADILDIEVPALMDAMRVDRAIAMLTERSRSSAVAMIADGLVVVDGAVVTKASFPLLEGAHLEVALPTLEAEQVEADPTVEVDLVHVDGDLVIVSKRFDQVVHPGAGNKEGTLVSGLLALFPEIGELPGLGAGEPARPGIVHRLDKGTSGLLVVARTPDAYYSLTEQMAAHSARRLYVGLIEGHVKEEQGIVDAPISRSASSPTKMAVRPDGRDARTRYRVLARLEGPPRTIIGLELDTGRTHQIRVHMAAIGNPVVNDPKYGQRNEKRLDHDRLALHAGRLSIVHPRTGDVLTARAPWPDDLAALGGAEEAASWIDGEGA